MDQHMPIQTAPRVAAFVCGISSHQLVQICIVGAREQQRQNETPSREVKKGAWIRIYAEELKVENSWQQKMQMNAFLILSLFNCT